MSPQLADFREFCRGATDSQLRNIYAKECLARRRSFAQVAKSVMQERGLV